ncbi:MAG: hypothetical protein ACRDFW_14510, partial [bacterium]
GGSNMRNLIGLVLAVAILASTAVSTAAVAGDIVPGGNGGVPGWKAVAGDIVPGGNGAIQTIHVAGDIVPGGNG